MNNLASPTGIVVARQQQKMREKATQVVRIHPIHHTNS